MDDLTEYLNNLTTALRERAEWRQKWGSGPDNPDIILALNGAGAAIVGLSTLLQELEQFDQQNTKTGGRQTTKAKGKKR